MSLEPCQEESCRHYGQCGECRDYHISAKQNPCLECKYCRQGG
nr:MAG TPA: 23S rRNA (uracil-5-)-methyltransferase [Caudoviricetes sp.]